MYSAVAGGQSEAHDAMGVRRIKSARTEQSESGKLIVKKLHLVGQAP